MPNHPAAHGLPELEPSPSWRIRAVAAVLVAAVFAVLVQLLFDVL